VFIILFLQKFIYMY